MLDDEYNVKVADFGLATEISGNNSDTGFLTVKAGTRGYMAPEISEKNSEYRGYQADLFALGVILFVLHSGERPFDAADKNDFYYHQLITAQNGEFFKMHEKSKPEGYYTPEFKDLILNMLAYKPHQRLTISDIIGHQWMRMGPVKFDDSDVRKELAERNALDKKERIARVERTNEKHRHLSTKPPRTKRSVHNMQPMDLEEVKENAKPAKRLFPYEPMSCTRQYCIVSTSHPNYLEGQIISKLNEMDI